MKFNEESIPLISEGETVSTTILIMKQYSGELLIISSQGGTLLLKYKNSTMNMPLNYTVFLKWTEVLLLWTSDNRNLFWDTLETNNNQSWSLPILLTIPVKSLIEEFKINGSKYIPCADSEGTEGYWDVVNKNFITNNTIGE